jgi:hypothetical protein
MNSPDSERASPRPIAAGLLIAAAAPPLVICPILTWFELWSSEVSFGHFSVLSTIVVAYFLGGVQSIVAGWLVALAIQEHGWIGTASWMGYAAVLGLFPVFLIYASEPSVILYFSLLILFASFALRLLVVRLRWMPKPRTRPTLVYH